MEQDIFVGPKDNPIGTIKRSEIDDYLTPEFYETFDVWSKWKKFGLPFPGTWMQQPKYIIDLIEFIDIEVKYMKK